jgi:toxin ParE1/3/4
VKVVIREPAARDLDDILDWILKDNPQAAARLVRRILTRIERLAVLPHVGRPGLRAGTRELVEPPYIIVYIVDEPADEITVLAIFHSARNREGS